MEKNKKTEILYTKNDFMIEFTRFDINYWLYVIRRSLAFFFDYGVVFGVQSIMYFVLQLSVLYSSLISMGLYITYNILFLIISDGRTLGMMLANLRVVHKTGFCTDKMNYIARSFGLTIYLIPILGWSLIVVSFISIILSKFITLIDWVSRTIVITENQYLINLKIESELDGKEKEKVWKI